MGEKRMCKSTVNMSDSKVETISRMAQWRIQNLECSTYKQSDPFKIGIWNWHLSVEKSRHLFIGLFLEPSRTSKEQPPAVKFVLRLIAPSTNSRPLVSPVYERVLGSSDEFFWRVESNPQGYFVIDVEFHDLKISQKSGEGTSIWPSESTMQFLATHHQTSLRRLRCLSRILIDSIPADVTINTADGSLPAHKAILCATSPIFHTMFLHKRHKDSSSSIDIQYMSRDSCMALLDYLYGAIKPEDFWKHRVPLLAAADEFNISDLKDWCEECLLEDINAGNVLERLQEAWIYQLRKLKKGCLMYLFDFGKIYDVKEEMMSEFFRRADRDLMMEMFREVTGYLSNCYSVPSYVVCVLLCTYIIGCG